MTDTRCSFCCRVGPDATPRIFGPMGVAICADCATRLLPHASAGVLTPPPPEIVVTPEWLSAHGRSPDSVEVRPPAAAVDGCSFCGQAADDVEKLFGTSHGSARICDACVRLAGDILSEEDADMRSS